MYVMYSDLLPISRRSDGTTPSSPGRGRAAALAESRGADRRGQILLKRARFEVDGCTFPLDAL